MVISDVPDVSKALLYVQTQCIYCHIIEEIEELDVLVSTGTHYKKNNEVLVDQDINNSHSFGMYQKTEFRTSSHCKAQPRGI